MKKKFLTVFFTALAVLFMQVVFAANTDIRLNSLGFIPGNDKRASVVPLPTLTVTGFTVKRASDNSIAYSGTLLDSGVNSDSNERIYTADFSPLTEQGTFYLDVPQVGVSYQFPVSETAYHEAYKTVMKAFYAWRCGCAVSWSYGGDTFQHSECHSNDGYFDYIDSTHVIHDGKGGWHDAGDYNKYIVNAGVTMGLLFFAWEHYKMRIQSIPLDNPETAPGYPEFLEELKYETDWILKMQSPDGRVYSKLSAINFSNDSKMPQLNTEARYFVPYSTAATADFTAILAMAARNFAPYDVTYSQQCLSAARVSYAYLTANTANVNPSQAAFSTGTYTTDDYDDRLWAAAELWQTTGEEVFHTDFKNKAAAFGPKVEMNMDWSSIRNLGMLTYLFSTRSNRDAGLVDAIRFDVIDAANGMVLAGNAHGYGRPMGTQYWWGSNGHVARQSLVLQSAYKLTGSAVYQNTALDAIGFLFGRNYFGRSFVTNLGYNPANLPHHRPSQYDAVAKAWPGYLVGGPNADRGDPVLNAMPAGLPAQQYWADNSNSYAGNEVAINWNSALVYALAGFIKDPPTPTNTPTATPTITGTPPTQTPSPTRTQTNTPGPTNTPVPPKFVEITELVSYPNPTTGNKITFRYVVAGFADKVTINIYTFGERKIYSVVKTGVYAGLHTEEWIPSMRLANGLYYFTIEGINSNSKLPARHVAAFFVRRD